MTLVHIFISRLYWN